MPPPLLRTCLILAAILASAGCSHRLEKAGSLTVRLEDGFSERNSPAYPGPTSFAYRPIKFDYFQWEYHSERKSTATKPKEIAKDLADSVGEQIVGQIMVTAFEVLIKGSIELGGYAVQSAFRQAFRDGVLVTIGDGAGQMKFKADPGFNRWKLLDSQKLVFAGPWRLELFSDGTCKYVLGANGIAGGQIERDGYVDIVLDHDGCIIVNDSAVHRPTAR